MGCVLRNTATITVVLPLAMALLMSGCNTSGCTDNKASIPLAGFYSNETLSAISVSQISIGGVDAPNDSLIVDNASASQVYLPFRADTDATQYYIHYHSRGIDDPAYNDTLTFCYNRLPYFASEECGAMYRYEVYEFSTTYHLIDSVAMVDTCITNADRETIQIYFRTYSEPPVEEEPDATEEPDPTEEPATGDNIDSPTTDQ